MPSLSIYTLLTNYIHKLFQSLEKERFSIANFIKHFVLNSFIDLQVCAF